MSSIPSPLPPFSLQYSHRVCFLDRLEHLLTVLVVLLVLLELLLALGQQHASEVGGPGLAVGSRPIHFHRRENFAEVCVRNAEARLLQGLVMV